MSKYHVSILRPHGYLHSSCFMEVAEGLRSALRTLGHEAVVGENTIDAAATTIVLGAHLLHQQEALNLPEAVIVYNLEQLGGAALPGWYRSLAKRLRIWDYSAANLALWKQEECREEPRLVEVGFAADLRRIVPAPVQDIDVLFYGSLNERRLQLLREIEASGLRLHVAFGVYGQQRDALIGRAKVVLNLHAYDTEIFETVRVSYLLANAKAVVSEQAPDMGELAQAVAVAPYVQLVATCRELVENPAQRQALESRGFRIFSGRNQARFLAGIVGDASASARAPQKIDLALPVA